MARARLFRVYRSIIDDPIHDSNNNNNCYEMKGNNNK